MLDLRKLVEDKKVKLTPAQDKLYKNLLRGCKIEIRNRHRMNGGEVVLVDSSGYMVDSRVYRAACNLSWKLDIEIFQEFKYQG